MSLGFLKDQATYIPENPAVLFFNQIERRLKTNNSTWIVEDKFVIFFKKFITRIKKVAVIEEVLEIIKELDEAENSYDILIAHKDQIIKWGVRHLIIICCITSRIAQRIFL